MLASLDNVIGTYDINRLNTCGFVNLISQLNDDEIVFHLTFVFTTVLKNELPDNLVKFYMLNF